MHLNRIAKILKSGVSDEGETRARIVVPEGYTLNQIADTLANEGVVSKSNLLDAPISNLHAAFPLPKQSLEGYLFPDTYLFGHNLTPERVLETMLINFNAKFYHPYQQQIAESKHDQIGRAHV